MSNDKNIEIMETSNIDYRVKRGNGYGQYLIVFEHKGEEIRLRTTDSEAFDWWDDDSNIEKHEEAKSHCEMKIQQYVDSI